MFAWLSLAFIGNIRGVKLDQRTSPSLPSGRSQCNNNNKARVGLSSRARARAGRCINASASRPAEPDCGPFASAEAARERKGSSMQTTSPAAPLRNIRCQGWRSPRQQDSCPRPTRPAATATSSDRSVGGKDQLFRRKPRHLPRHRLENSRFCPIAGLRIPALEKGTHASIEVSGAYVKT